MDDIVLLGIMVNPNEPGYAHLVGKKVTLQIVADERSDSIDVITTKFHVQAAVDHHLVSIEQPA